MASLNLLEIERSIRALSLEEQLWLLERITRQVREKTQNQLPLVVTVVVGTKGTNIPRDYPTNVRVSTADSGLQ
jgi:hypothetical protein